MKQDQILEELLIKAKANKNILGFIVFGSVALGTQHEKSDIDIIEILRKSTPTSGMENTMIDGIKVGKLFFTYEILSQSIEEVPYLLHVLCNAKLLFDRENTIKPLLEKIEYYFEQNSEIVNLWNKYYKQLKAEKEQFGYDKTTIIDVWNELESRYSGGIIKRQFFTFF